eukprot:TRINITY_DN8212_c0_g1_i1.p1 TRINITY_DN8212_c0_g1~~TRINITY_DN8212_c0_g1_i1.p1  ORF type:complete len:354 (+),score=112.72 TRINITY_DN8212_c0_g1_i1:133-1194(+)
MLRSLVGSEMCIRDRLLGKLKCELVKEVKNEGVMGELVESVLGKCEEVHSLEESTAQAVSSLLSAAQKNEGAKMLASLIEEQSQGCDAIDVEAELGEWQAWCKCTELSGEQQDGVRKLMAEACHALGQGTVVPTIGKGVGIRAALKELLSMEQIAQVLVAASSTENVIRDCSLMGLSVESEGELDAASMFIGGEAPVSTGSGMHAWWVKKCSKSLGLTADQSERVQKRMAEYNTSVSTKREEVDVLLGKLKCELVKEVKNEGVMGELVESVLGKCEEVHSLEESTAQAVSSLLSAAQKNEGAKMLASLIEEQSQGCDAIDVEAQLGEWQAWCKCTELSGEQQDGVRKLLQHPH